MNQAQPTFKALRRRIMARLDQYLDAGVQPVGVQLPMKKRRIGYSGVILWAKESLGLSMSAADQSLTIGKSTVYVPARNLMMIRFLADSVTIHLYPPMIGRRG